MTPLAFGHLGLAVFGFACACVPAAARLRASPEGAAPHLAMAGAMGVMAVTGMQGAARFPLVLGLLVACAAVWYVLPRRREHLHVATDLLAMALLVLLAAAHTAADPAGGHVHAAPPWAGSAAVLAFWACMQGVCLVRPASRPCLRDGLSSAGMIGAMAAMGLLPAH